MAIPDNAEKAHDGVLFDVYQWPQTLFNGETATYESVKCKFCVVHTIGVVGNRILFNEEEQPHVGTFCNIPSGFANRDNPKQEALRELMEETGYFSNDIELYYEYNLSPQVERKSYLYIARNCVKVANQELDTGSERIRNRLLTLDEFFEEIERPDFRSTTVRDYLFRVRHTPEMFSEFKRLLYKT